MLPRLGVRAFIRKSRLSFFLRGSTTERRLWRPFFPGCARTVALVPYLELLRMIVSQGLWQTKTPNLD